MSTSSDTPGVQPIRPEDVLGAQLQYRPPDTVFEVFNELIARNFRSGRATVMQQDAENLVVERLGLTDPEVIYTERWFDIERHYRAQGWTVEYDKPGYCETYPAKFTFSYENGTAARPRGGLPGESGGDGPPLRA